MHDHFEQSDGRDPDMFEVMRVLLPWSSIVNRLLCFSIVRIKSVAVRVDELNGIFQLYR